MSDIEQTSQFSMAEVAGRMKRTDSSHLLWVKLGLVMFSTVRGWYAKHAESVKLVLRHRDVFKVTHMVVGLVSVTVVYLKSLWSRSDEMFGDKMMDQSGCLRSMFAHGHMQIATPLRMWSEDDSGPMEVAPVFSWKAPKAAVVADFIDAFVPRHRGPMFIIHRGNDSTGR